MSHDHDVIKAQSTGREYFKLFAIYVLLALAAVGMTSLTGFVWAEWMRWFMGGFFIVFGAFKLIGYEMFASMFPMYDLVAQKYKLYAYLYPFIELFLGFSFVFNIGGVLRDIVTLAIMVIGLKGITQHLKSRRRHALYCACLGNVIRLPLSTVTVFEDLLMAVMAGFMIIYAVFM